MIQHEGERRRVQPGVHRMPNGADHRHAVVASSMAGVFASITETVSPFRMPPRPAPKRGAARAHRIRHSSCAHCRDDRSEIGKVRAAALKEGERG